MSAPPSAAPLVVRPDEVPGDEASAPPREPEPEPEPEAVATEGGGAASPPKAAPDTARIELRAPATVRWADAAASLGSGARRATVKSSTAFLTAVDVKRGVRSRVPVVRGVADYGALPKGRIQVRATPYAEIFLGSEPRGSTPYHDVEVVAGEYTLTLKNRGREEKRTVTVKAGEVARVDVRFP
ncbi:MAG: hypothetical protein A2138_22485 [Deltaproteobacteria bacterium RBG_16_71_12]|nr:MAG: hypothetical protein A2138_22485 [Deltaproteobacteria bacterium RBG_16_71_12]